MRFISRAILLPVLLLLLIQQIQPAHAGRAAFGIERGMPGSPDFGFGALVQPNGPRAADATALAGKLGLDWISLPVNWAAVQPDGKTSPNFAALDAVLKVSGQEMPAVMISLSGAPGWAMTAKGPDAGQTTQFVSLLINRYPAVKAVELFPGANTQSGWGSTPNPTAYASLFRAVGDGLRGAGSGVLLVAAGLKPQAANTGAGNMSDLDFLAGLYQQGAASSMPVISIQYTNVASDPLRYPDGSEHRIVRHYEEVRQVMLANQHTTGRIWITRFSLPSGTIEVQDVAPIDLSAQSNWMIQGVTQMRSQLYIGVVFLASLNSNGEGTASELLVLLQGDGAQHPFTTQLGEMISLNRAGSASITPGKAKDGSFEKKRP